MVVLVSFITPYVCLPISYSLALGKHVQHYSKVGWFVGWPVRHGIHSIPRVHQTKQTKTHGCGGLCFSPRRAGGGGACNLGQKKGGWSWFPSTSTTGHTHRQSYQTQCVCSFLPLGMIGCPLAMTDCGVLLKKSERTFLRAWLVSVSFDLDRRSHPSVKHIRPNACVHSFLPLRDDDRVGVHWPSWFLAGRTGIEEIRRRTFQSINQ